MTFLTSYISLFNNLLSQRHWSLLAHTGGGWRYTNKIIIIIIIIIIIMPSGYVMCNYYSHFVIDVNF